MNVQNDEVLGNAREYIDSLAASDVKYHASVDTIRKSVS